jgi:hypothetical protein
MFQKTVNSFNSSLSFWWCERTANYCFENRKRQEILQRVKTVRNVFKHIKGNTNTDPHVRSKLKLLKHDISTASVWTWRMTWQILHVRVNDPTHERLSLPRYPPRYNAVPTLKIPLPTNHNRNPPIKTLYAFTFSARVPPCPTHPKLI